MSFLARTLLAWLLSGISCYSYVIAVYIQQPIADKECASAIISVLSQKHTCRYITHDKLTPQNLTNVDCIVFPGGLGDVDNFDSLLKDKQKIIQNFFYSKKIYVGICMGAYLAGPDYFDLLEDVQITQYISRKHSEIKTEAPAIVNCRWQQKLLNMYFFDGPVFLGNIKPNEVIASYQNKEAAAIVKKTKTGTFIGIGPHPESMKNWYNTKELKPHWHNKTQHKLILDLLDNVER